MTKKAFILLILFNQSIQADIFGTDNRKNVVMGSSQYLLSRSVAVGVINSLWTPVNSLLSELWADPAQDFLCSDERFSSQQIVSYACTGWLVGPDLLITAGHCGVNGGEVHNTTENYCEAYTWMFDYYTNTDTANVPRNNIFKCKQIIYAGNTGEEVGDIDFTILRLDRMAHGRSPLKLAETQPRLNDEVFMLGHPMGLPMKITDEAHIFKLDQKRSFLTNLDAFAGNSGSPVFNKFNEVIGLLVAGNPAQSTYKDGDCDRYNTCDENGENCNVAVFNDGLQGFPHTFSEVQSIQFYKEIIKKHPSHLITL